MFFNVPAVGYSGDSRLSAAYSGDFESSLQPTSPFVNPRCNSMFLMKNLRRNLPYITY
jgi:hypothetical protein